jgi:hypothetical protein
MKKVKKLGIRGDMLTAARNAEASLAREERAEIVDALPEGHPLREVAARGFGDLADLPEGHPLLMQLRGAKARYDEMMAQRGKEQAKASVTKTQKAATKAEKAKRSREAHDAEEQIKGAIGVVNAALLDAARKIASALRIVSEQEAVLASDRVMAVRVVRTKRLLQAVELGLSSSKLKG